jgi:biopolymer transport protein ExbB
MKKLFALFTVAAMLSMSVSSVVAQDAKKDNKAVAKTEVKKDAKDAKKDAKADTTKAVASDSNAMAEKPAVKDTATAPAQERSFHQVLKDKFIEGGAGWMAPILICMILGLALVVERIIYLNMASTNSKKLLAKIEASLNEGGVDAAKEICRNTRGPLASVFYQGLDRHEEGIEIVEKSVVSYGSVQMGRLESNLGWIGLAIALAPMLGFLGTVVGMVQAFDDIEKAGDISPTVVAAGMKVALLTTVFGLITALILQVFYSYLISKIDSIVNQMEDATISFMDILVKFKR